MQRRPAPNEMVVTKGHAAHNDNNRADELASSRPANNAPRSDFALQRAEFVTLRAGWKPGGSTNAWPHKLRYWRSKSAVRVAVFPFESRACTSTCTGRAKVVDRNRLRQRNGRLSATPFMSRRIRPVEDFCSFVFRSSTRICIRSPFVFGSAFNSKGS